MSGNNGLPVTGPVATALARLGLPETDPNLVEIVPTAARGTNLVVVTPPAALHAAPGLAGAMSALSSNKGILLVLVAEAALGEWEAVIASIARDTGQTVHTVRTLSRASRLLLAGTVNILITPPEAALALAQRSALKAEQITGVFMAWPEFWDSDEPLTPLMQDIGRDVQRIIYTTEQNRVATLVERHARRAHTVGPVPGEMMLPEAETGSARSAGVVRLVSCSWQQRAQALKETIELLDPASSAAWTLSHHPDFTPPLPPGTSLAARKIPRDSLIVAFDIPTAAQLTQLASAGEVVVLVPPTAQTWIKRVLPEAKLLRLPGPSDAIGKAIQARRQQIIEAIETRPAEEGLLALGPLFERYDSATLAAILYDLWLERPAPAATAPPPGQLAPEVMSSATARVWVGVGKKDGATPNDFVGVLTKELRYDRAKIGKIEVRELYSLVEIPAGDAESLANRLTGVTIRRRRVTARIDKGGKVRSAR